MQNFSMVCTCGDPMSVQAENLDDAKMQMKTMMTQEAIDAHCTEKHPGMTITKVQMDADIDSKLMAA